jgi:hypothetical protein
MSDDDIEPDVRHLAAYLLGDPPYRAATVEEQARRVHSLATAVQRAVDAWLTANPVGGRPKQPRQRWARVYADEV